MSRAALELECEQRYIEMVVPEGGVGGLLGMAELMDVGAATSRACFC
jgi:hypothetical protein